MPTPSWSDESKCRVRSNVRLEFFRYVEQHGAHDGVAEHSTALEQQTKTYPKVIASAVHRGKPVDQRFASVGSSGIKTTVESHTDALDGMQLERNQNVSLTSQGGHDYLDDPSAKYSLLESAW
jgi:hypothetical protein